MPSKTQEYLKLANRTAKRYYAVLGTLDRFSHNCIQTV